MPKFWVRILSMSLGLWAIAACDGSGVDLDVSVGSDVSQNTNRAAVLSLACTGCHGAAQGAIVSLDGYTADQVKAALQMYVADADGTTVMHRLARGYSPDEINQISAHIGNAETVR